MTRQRRFEELPSSSPENVKGLASDHPAMVQKLPLFENSIVKVEDSPRIFVSGQNNRKIGRVVTRGEWSGKAIYTLTLPERATCPTSCHAFSTCYGNSMPFSRRHWHGEALEARIPIELAELLKQHAAGIVIRLHVLGDFYSLPYVGIWRKMLEQHPKLCVFGYTARLPDSTDQFSSMIGKAIESLNRDFADRWQIRFSAPTSRPMGTTIIDRRPEAGLLPEGVCCPAERFDSSCCAQCALCWSPSMRAKTIVFMRHGMGSRHSDVVAKTASATDENGVRKIEPIANISRVAGAVRNEPPTLMWVKPEELYVDESYQRGLSRKSIKLITSIVQAWDWTHFKPPIVVKDEDTDRLLVIDGQHTAIAAATHPDIEKIPIMVVDAETLQARAKAFIGHNRDRIAISAMQLHHSAIVAEDPEAMGVDEVCKATGVVVVRYPPPNGVWNIGETIALGSIRKLLKTVGVESTKTVLKLMVAAECAPLRGDQMMASSKILFGEYKGTVTPERLTEVLRELPYEKAVNEARDLSSSTGQKVYDSLAVIYAKAATPRVKERQPEPAE
jgi:hypothetical protein